jgi:hypothetical protein
MILNDANYVLFGWQLVQIEAGTYVVSGWACVLSGM